MSAYSQVASDHRMMSPRHRFCGAIFPFLLAGLSTPFPTLAATHVVTTLGDSSRSLTDGGARSLRQAISDAMSGDTVYFATNGTIVLTAELKLTKNLKIIGNGSDRVAISGDDKYRAFVISQGTTSSLNGLVISGGFTASTGGAGILNYGDLSVVSCTISNNRTGSINGRGGGICNFGTATAKSS